MSGFYIFIVIYYYGTHSREILQTQGPSQYWSEI